MSHHKLIIIWSWPAWHTAAIYAARANLEPLMFEWRMAGGVAAWGQLTTTTIVENFPGFPHGIDGPKLMEDMRAQSITAWTQVLTQTVDSVDLSVRPFKLSAGGQLYTADSIIISTWATAKKLDLPGASEYWMRGISGCAVCDGALPMFRNRPIVIVGGGDVAVEEAIHMTHFSSKVYVLVRSDRLRASAAMQAKLMSNDKIEILRYTEVTEILGDSNRLTSVNIINNQTNETSTLEVAGLFFAIGHTPNTSFLGNQVTIDEIGYIITTPGTTRTSVQWVFAAGDVQDKIYRQAVTSAGTWCMAALEAEKWLQN